LEGAGIGESYYKPKEFYSGLRISEFGIRIGEFEFGFDGNFMKVRMFDFRLPSLIWLRKVNQLLITR